MENGIDTIMVAVCGAGAAGVAAALAAARAGAPVCLIDAANQPGGTVANCLIHTLGGLFNGAGEVLNGGLAAELVAALTGLDMPAVPRQLGRVWVLNTCPDLYRKLVQRWLASEPRITPILGTSVTGATVVAGRVTHLQLTGALGARQL